MVFISNKQYLTCPWLQFVPTHRQNMRFHTGNVGYVFVKNVYVLISQVRNQIRTTQTHILQYVFMHTKWSHNVSFIADTHQTKNNMFIVLYSYTK